MLFQIRQHGPKFKHLIVVLSLKFDLEKPCKQHKLEQVNHIQILTLDVQKHGEYLHYVAVDYVGQDDFDVSLFYLIWFHIVNLIALVVFL